MGKSVKNSLPDSRSGKRVSLRSPVRSIIDPGLLIFEINKIHHLICNPNERTFQSVLIWRIGAGAEFADSDTAAILNYPGILMKQKNRRFLKLAVRHKMELAEKFSIGDIELFLSHPFAAESLAPENLKTLFIQIIDSHVIGSFLLPAGSGLSHDKFRESNPCKQDVCPAAPEVVFPLAAYRIRARVHPDFNIVKPLPGSDLNISRNTEFVPDRCRNFLSKVLGAVNSGNSMGIIKSDVHDSASGIGKAAQPAKAGIIP
jgi:hypothetical protein